MQTVVTELYGIAGMFFITNVGYELPRVSYTEPIRHLSTKPNQEKATGKPPVLVPASIYEICRLD